WGLIGSATPGGWDTDTDMVFDPATGLWSVTLDLIGGMEIKFRANDAWDWNNGDDESDGSLEVGAANILIADGGNYTVILDLTTPRNYTDELIVNEGGLGLESRSRRWEKKPAASWLVYKQGAFTL